MRKFLVLLVILLNATMLGWLAPYSHSAGWWGGGGDSDRIPYCTQGECTLQGGEGAIRESLGDQITSKPLSKYIQEYVGYLLGFISIVAVLFVIWSGFRIMTSQGDEDTVKRSRTSILYVVIGIIVMWLAYSLVNWILSTLERTERGGYTPSPFQWVFTESAHAAYYSESEQDTFLEYKGRIQVAIQELEAEFRINKKVDPAHVEKVKNLLQPLADRLPDRDRTMAEQNDSAKRWAETLLTISANNPNSGSDLREAISAVSKYISSAQIEEITGTINATPTEGNAPLAVSFRATNIKDPSGTIPPASNHIWWIRENGGARRELGRGASLMHTFHEEGTFTVFLDVVSASRNSKGRTDVLPLSTSVQIEVKPKLGEVILLINGVNVSNLQTLKISPSVASQGLLLDASASRAIGNGIITETKWDFGNNNSSTYRGAPVVERQVFSNQGQYPLKLSFKTNDGQTFAKELLLDIREPAAVIRLEKTSFHVGESVSFGVETFFQQGRNIEYIWEIQDENGKRIVRSPNGLSFSHTFEQIGSYIVTLTARHPNGQIDTDSQVITVESRDPVVAMDQPKSLRSENPNTFVFDATKSYDPDTNSRQNLTYTWRLNGNLVRLDDSSNNGAKGTLTFDTLGENTISVTVANARGKIATTEQTFRVDSLLSVGLIVTPQVIQSGDRMYFIARAPNADFFEWDMGDGSQRISGNSRSVQHVYQKSGVYTVTLTVSRSGSNQTNTISQKVYVTNAHEPMAIMSVRNLSNSVIEEPGLCQGNEAYTVNRSEATTFDASKSVNVDGNPDNLDYTWKYMGKISTNSSITETFGDLGCYPVELTVRSKTTGATNTLTKYIELRNQPPELTSITAQVDTTKKDSQKLLVKVNANGVTDKDGVVTSYIWYYTTESDPEPQNIQITQNPTITFVLPNITEKYYFGVILEDNDGARVNSMDRLQKQSPLLVDNANGNIYMPLISLSVPKTTIKAGEKIRLSATAKTIIGNDITNKAQYAWDFDGDGRIDERTSTPNTEHTYSRAGDFTLRVRATYNGVSNTKYQNIHVRNELKASADVYRLPNNQIYLINTSQGVYDKTRWTIGEDSAYGLHSHIIDATDITDATDVIGKISVSNNDSEVAQADISLKNAFSVSASGTGIVYQAYPRPDENDTIRITDPGQGLKISLYGNTASTYAIDTNTNMDSNLDGTTDNDIDNRESPSYTDGSLFIIPNFLDATSRTRDIKITLYEGTTPVSTKTIHLILEFLSETPTEDETVSSFGSKELTEFEREKLETLAELIRSLNDGDRIIVMKKYNILSENWDIPLERAKALIDIQEYVTYSPSIDTGKKEDIAHTIDELLVGSANSNNAIEIATRLIRDLIPENSPNREALLERLDTIASQPENRENNRRLGQEMLEMILNDDTIEDKYKLYIKDQLIIITQDGDSETPAPQKQPQGSGLSGMVGTIIQIFLVIVGLILFAGIVLFIYYRMSRKEGESGFQDFIIDRVFHSKKSAGETKQNDTAAAAQQDIATKTAASIQEALNPHSDHDPLRSYTPPDPINTLTSSNPEVTESLPSDENVPDWLKSTSESDTTPASIPNSTPETIPEIAGTNHLDASTDTTTSGEDGAIPDWLKGLQPTENTSASETHSETTVPPENTGGLPDWLTPPAVHADEHTQGLPDPLDMSATSQAPIAQEPPKAMPIPQDDQGMHEDADSDLPDWLKDIEQTSDMQKTASEEQGTNKTLAEEGEVEVDSQGFSLSDTDTTEAVSTETLDTQNTADLPEWLRASLGPQEENSSESEPAQSDSLDQEGENTQEHHVTPSTDTSAGVTSENVSRNSSAKKSLPITKPKKTHKKSTQKKTHTAGSDDHTSFEASSQNTPHIRTEKASEDGGEDGSEEPKNPLPEQDSPTKNPPDLPLWLK